MFKGVRPEGKIPLIDLDTVRETLLYMRDDMRRDPATHAVARALDEALHEIALVDVCDSTPAHRTILSKFLARPL